MHPIKNTRVQMPFFGTGGEVQMALLQLFLVNQDEHMLDKQGAEKTCAS